MTALTIAVLALTAAAALLVFMTGHHFGRRSRRPGPDDRAAGYREGVQAEAARWEKVTGVSFDRLQSWRSGRGPDPFAATEVLPSAEVLLAEADAALGKPPKVPSVAEVDELTAEYEAMVARQKARGYRFAPRYEPPVLADITDAARPYTAQEIRDGRRFWGQHWGAPGEPGHIRDDPRMAATLTGAIVTGDEILRALADDDQPTLTGVIVGSPRDRTGPEWLDAQLAAMDSETAAYLRRVEAEMASFRRGIGPCS